MKKAKKIFSMLLAALLTLSLGGALAEGTETCSITIKNPQTNVTYAAYKVFDLSVSADKTAYSYTIKSSDLWFDVVMGYMGYTESNGKWNKDGAEATAPYSGNGLTLTPAPGATTTVDGKTVYTYVVTYEQGEFSAANFAAELLKAVESPTVDATNNTVSAKIGSAATATEGKGFTEDTTSTAEPKAQQATGLELGYYLVFGVEDGEGGNKVKQALAELTSNATDIVIREKNAWPKFTKTQAQSENGNAPTNAEAYKADAFSAQIGDTVYYKITDEVPGITGYTKFDYIVSDTMTEGLTLKLTDDKSKPDVTIKVGNAQVYPDATTNPNPWTVELLYGTYNADGTVNTDNSKPSTTKGDNDVVVGFRISVDFVTTNNAGEKIGLYAEGTDIAITYTATVNEKAVYGVETNTAKLTFSNDPGNSESTKETPEEKTHVYNAAIDVVKFDGETGTVTDGKLGAIAPAATPTYLSGAEFVLYKNDNGTTKYYKYTAAAVDGTTSAKVEWDATQTNATVLKTNSSGKLEPATGTNAPSTGTTTYYFGGLEAGTYYLLETKAPAGYNLLTEPVTVKIEATENNNTWTWTATNGKTEDTDKVTYTITGGDATVNVANNAGSLLPSTGGAGTTVFYIVGGALVLAAAVLLITRRRMSK